MSEANARFLGTIPELYDRHLGPVLFEPYAVDLARRVAAATAAPVLEVACGTGILTQQLRTHLSPTVRLVATDLNQPMIEVAGWLSFYSQSPQHASSDRSSRTHPSIVSPWISKVSRRAAESVAKPAASKNAIMFASSAM
jgi:hypothetical protein